MADISIQFYAIGQEIGTWLEEWLHIHGATLVAMTFHPFSVKEVESQGIREALRDQAVRQLCLFVAKPKLDVRYKSDFEHANPDRLMLGIGSLTEEGLHESWLACRTDNADALKSWRRIAKDLKAKTKAGVTGVNRQNGVSAFYKSDRYSHGAKELEDAGTPMLSITGAAGPIIRLGRVNEAPEAIIDE